MSYQSINADGSVETTCTYGASKLLYRGPQRALERPYVACFGGEETFGRFVEAPYPSILEHRLQRRCLNFGSLFCGLESLTRDSGLLELANQSELCVLQLPGLLGQTNRFYRVHPRRNDRFVAPTSELVGLYPEIDFTDVHFVRHLLSRLKAHTDARFEMIEQELRKGWVERLGTFLSKVKPPVMLLELKADHYALGSVSDDPVTLDTSSVEVLVPQSAGLITLHVQVSGASDELEDMLFGTLQQPIAEHMIGPATHRRIADALTRAIRDLGI
ncbi:DUF6473 family protein [Ruegeria conchae]|uniref:DUF6473 family protein n=1 Tax=Ruegeria conchae TaxID=981384 RepID=UPI0029C8BB20|nr:DUF6473 family protein [Ruegeria conchae]